MINISKCCTQNVTRTGEGGGGLSTQASWKQRPSQRFLGSDLLGGFPQEERGRQSWRQARMGVKPGKKEVSFVLVSADPIENSGLCRTPRRHPAVGEGAASSHPLV